MEQSLEGAEDRLASSVLSGDPFLDEVATHLIAAGGKRLRPALALAAATGGVREAGERDLLGAVAAELVHLGSLYHDDVMDEAILRRGTETVNARWGSQVAVVAGDFLLARSAEIAAGLGPHFASLLAGTLQELCRGQVAEIQTAYRTSRTVEQYFEAIAGKTAALMESSCRIGAMTASLPDSETDALAAFGNRLGMAFQVHDDVMDIVGTTEELGKVPGKDLVEGIYTLPTILAMQDEDVGPDLISLLGRRLGPGETDEARTMISSTPAVGQAIEVADSWVAAATGVLRATIGVPASEALAALATSILGDVLSPS